MPALARLVLAVTTLAGGGYALFVSPALSGTTPAPPIRATAAAGTTARRPAAAPAAVTPTTETAPDDGELDALLVRSREAVGAERWTAALEPTRRAGDPQWWAGRVPGQARRDLSPARPPR